MKIDDKGLFYSVELALVVHKIFASITLRFYINIIALSRITSRMLNSMQYQ